MALADLIKLPNEMNVHFLGESHHAHAHKPIDTRFICSLLDDTHPTFVIANFSQFLILMSVVTMARLPIVFERQILTNTYSHSPTHTQRAHTHTQADPLYMDMDTDN